jgi:hypothetical protein
MALLLPFGIRVGIGHRYRNNLCFTIDPDSDTDIDPDAFIKTVQTIKDFYMLRYYYRWCFRPPANNNHKDTSPFLDQLFYSNR